MRLVKYDAYIIRKLLLYTMKFSSYYYGMDWNVAVTIGRETWPTGCCLRFMAGSHLSSVDRVLVPSVGPRGSHKVILPITSPAEHGIYHAQWRLSTFTGIPFGGRFSVMLLFSVCDVCYVRQERYVMPVVCLSVCLSVSNFT